MSRLALSDMSGLINDVNLVFVQIPSKEVLDHASLHIKSYEHSHKIELTCFLHLSYIAVSSTLTGS